MPFIEVEHISRMHEGLPLRRSLNDHVWNSMKAGADGTRSGWREIGALAVSVQKLPNSKPFIPEAVRHLHEQAAVVTAEQPDEVPAISDPSGADADAVPTVAQTSGKKRGPYKKRAK